MTTEAYAVRYIGENGHPFVYVAGKNCDRIEVSGLSPEPYCVVEFVTVWRGSARAFAASLQKVEHVFFQEPGNGDTLL